MTAYQVPAGQDGLTATVTAADPAVVTWPFAAVVAAVSVRPTGGPARIGFRGSAAPGANGVSTYSAGQTTTIRVQAEATPITMHIAADANIIVEIVGYRSTGVLISEPYLAGSGGGGGGSAPDATTTTKGLARLLGGTADAPTVPASALTGTLDPARLPPLASGAVPISLVDAKGDQLVGSADDTLARVPVGADGKVWTADSTAPAGVSWQTPPSGSGGSAPSVTSADEGRSLAVIGGAYALSADPTRLPLKRFRQALATSSTTPLNWWALGDSITVGVGASKWDNGYAARLLRALQRRAELPGRGGAGYVNTVLASFTSGAATDTYWTFTGGTSSGTSVPSIFGRSRRVTFTAATLTFTGTSFRLHFQQGDAASVPFTVTIDGGAPTTVTPSTTGGATMQGVWTSPTVTRGAHTVVVAPVNAGASVVLYGATLFDGDETGGVHLYNGGVTGFTSTDYLSGPGASFVDQQAVAPDPALVTINLGTNDSSSSSLQANLTQLIANVKAVCTITPSFLILVPARPTGATSWTPYQAAAKAAAAADPTNVAVLDLFEHFVDQPSAGNGYTRGLLSSDGYHPTDAGHRFFAQLTLGRLLGPHRPLDVGAPSPQDTADALTKAAARLDVLQAPTVALTDAATVAVNAATGRAHRLTLGGDRTIGNPTGAYDGQLLLLTVAQDATGGRVPTLASKYRLPAGTTTLPWSTAAGRKDKLLVQYDQPDDRFDVLAFQPGYGGA